MSSKNIVIFNSNEESNRAFKHIEKLKEKNSNTTLSKLLNDFALESLFLDFEKVEKFNRETMDTFQFRLPLSVHKKLKAKSEELNIPMEKLIIKTINRVSKFYEE